MQKDNTAEKGFETSSLLGMAILGITLFTVALFGLITNVMELPSTHAIGVLIGFQTGTVLVYVVGRKFPQYVFRAMTFRSFILSLFSSLLVAGIFGVLVFWVKSGATGLSYLISLVGVAVLFSLFLTVSFLRWNDEPVAASEKQLSLVAYLPIIISAVIVLMLTWLMEPLRSIVFLLMPAISVVLAFFGENNSSPAKARILDTVDDQKPIHLSRYMHVLLFAYAAVFGFCFCFFIVNWTTLVITVVAVVLCLGCIAFYQSSYKGMKALGFFNKSMLPACILLLFCCVIDSNMFGVAVVSLATVFCLWLGPVNVHILSKTSATYGLRAGFHIIEGRLPSCVGLLFGLCLGCGLIIFGQEPDSPVFKVTVVLLALMSVMAYTFLPSRAGVLVEEGFIDYSKDEAGEMIYLDQAIEKNDALRQKCDEIALEHSLTLREQEVFFLLACGYNTESIAEILFISSSTVKTHAYRIYQKVGVHSQQEIIRRVNPI